MIKEFDNLKMESKKENIIVEMTFQFALDIIEFSELLEAKRRFVLANQLLRSGISIGANVREAQNAESKADFIHKMKVAAKEADESEYLLLLCKQAKSYPENEVLLEKIVSISKVLSKIIGSSKRNGNFQITESANHQIN